MTAINPRIVGTRTRLLPRLEETLCRDRVALVTDRRWRLLMSEIDCGRQHLSIEDAIAHARRNLDARAGERRGVQDVEPYWGTMGSSNVGWVVGYLVTARRRWRLDFDPNPDKLVHVNEENFDLPPSRQKVIHKVKPAKFDVSGKPIADDTQARLYWRKWTTRYGQPGLGVLCAVCRVYHSGGRCPFP